MCWPIVSACPINVLFFLEFFRNLFFVIGGNSIVLNEKRFSSIDDIFFNMSLFNVTFITNITPSSKQFLKNSISLFNQKFHYYFTIFTLFFITGNFTNLFFFQKLLTNDNFGVVFNLKLSKNNKCLRNSLILVRNLDSKQGRIRAKHEF